MDTELLEKTYKKLLELEKKLEIYYQMLYIENELDFILKGTYVSVNEMEEIVNGTY